MPIPMSMSMAMSMSIPVCWNCGTVYDPPAPKIKWRGEAQSYFMRCPQPPGYGIADRVYDIADCFMPPPDRDEYSHELVEDELVEDEDEVDLERKEGLLEELKAYDVEESIDVASVLHSKGRLFSFLGHVLSNKHACIRATAAELITTMVHDNPTNQQLVIEANGLQLLLRNFTSYPDDETSRIKTLVAISALLRENKSGITVFRREHGYAALRNALISKRVRRRSTIYREVINLIYCLLMENKLYDQASEVVFVDQSGVQEAALSGLLLLTGNRGLLPTVQSMINRSKSCFRISHLLLFPTLQKKKKKQSVQRKKEKNKPLLKKKSNSSSKIMKLH